MNANTFHCGVRAFLKSLLPVYLLTIGILGVPSVAVSQNCDLAPSPNIASFMKYIDMPVSLYSGTPGIEIPIYTVQSGSLTLPISLNYHASGIKPDELPGWVGMGWSLQAGGAICRKVNNFPDDLYVNYGAEAYNQYLGLYGCDIKGSAGQWHAYTDQIGKIGFDPYLNKPTDLASDEYYYNFGNYSGKFVLTDEVGESGKRIFYAINDPGLKIEPIGSLKHLDPSYPLRICEDNLLDYSILMFHFHGFKITTPDGIVYEFGNIPNSVEYSTSFYPSGDLSDATSIDAWYLTKIYSLNSKDIISLIYSESDPMIRLNENFSYSSRGTYDGPGCGEFSEETSFLLKNRNDLYIAPTQPATVNYNISGRVIFPVHLSQITFKNGNISFIKSKQERLSYLHNENFIKSDYYIKDPFFRAVKYHDNNFDCQQPVPELFMMNFINKAYQLDEIWVDLDYGGDKNFLFEYNTSNIERLRLKSFREEGMPPYEFYYLGYELEGYSKLPAYLTHKTNWNGYYTGAHNQLFIAFKNWEQRYIFDLSYPEIRDALGFWLLMGQTSLQDYENYFRSYYRDEINNNCLAGTLGKVVYPTGGYTIYEYELHDAMYSVNVSNDNGLGLKDIEHHPGGIRIKNIKKYDMNNTPVLSKTFDYELGIANGEPQYFWSNTLYNAEGIDTCWLTMHKFSSNNISSLSVTNTPSPVVYSKVTESTHGQGKTVYYFRNFMDHPEIYAQDELDAGHHLHLDRPLDADYSFTTKKLPLIGQENFRGQLIRKLYYQENDTLPIRSEYYEYSNSYVPTSYILMTDYIEAEPVYINSNNELYRAETIARLYYEYPFFLGNLELSKKRILDRSDNKSIETVSNYRYNQYRQLINEKLYGNKIIETEYLYSGDYDPEYARYFPVIINMKNKNILSSPVEKRVYVGQNKYLVDGEFQDYVDIGGGKFYPGTLYKLNLIDPVLPGNNYGESFGSYYKANGILFPGLEEETLTKYDPNGNLIEVTLKNGMTTSYAWGYNNSLPVVKAENISYADLINYVNSAASVAGLDIDTWIRNLQTEKEKWQNFNDLLHNYCGKDAVLTTYTYRPLVGMTSMTDANGITTYYEYDSLERLKLIRDNDGNILKKYDYQYAKQ